MIGKIFACTILLSLCILSSLSTAEGSNWKLYYKNTPIKPGINCNIYYDKDSVYYSKEKDGFFGKKKDKSFIGLWTKTTCQDNTDMKMHIQLSCQTRQITIKAVMAGDQYIYPPQLNRTFYVEPGSTDELLVKIFCK
jgi:hypothetical protein